MRVNIITKGEWILRRLAQEAQKALPGITINEEGDINYFINYALWRPMNGMSIGHFTHIENLGPMRELFIRSIPLFKYCTVPCEIRKKVLLENGAKNVWKIPYGTDRKKEIIFGVMGRACLSGRKGEVLVERINEKYSIRAFGSGWPCKTEPYVYENISKFLESIDYLVVTSIVEGGPVPVLDAIALGVPVIAPNVGFCWEHPVIKYEAGSWESLDAVLYKLTNPPTWKQWTEKHRELFMTVA